MGTVIQAKSLICTVSLLGFGNVLVLFRPRDFTSLSRSSGGYRSRARSLVEAS